MAQPKKITKIDIAYTICCYILTERKENKMPKPKRKEGTSCLYIMGIPTVLKNYYKAHCIKKGTTMTDDIIKHMKSSTKIARQVDEDIE
jgi:hypothetical protein